VPVAVPVAVLLDVDALLMSAMLPLHKHERKRWSLPTANRHSPHRSSHRIR
jgi:hypothetical protein